jgi:membrane protease YdiL (CAAX protease family)
MVARQLGEIRLRAIDGAGLFMAYTSRSHVADTGPASPAPSFTMSPLGILLSVACAAGVLYYWLADHRAWKAGKPAEKPLPGATSAPWGLAVFSALATVAIVGVETGGEYYLGAGGEQSTVAAVALLAWIGAGIVEEVIFRGFLVVESKGRAALVGSIVFFSLVFALLHGHLLVEGGPIFGYSLTFAAAPILWTLCLVARSLLWYGVRFSRFNPNRSLIPCFAGHIAGNVAVFVIKLAQGHVSGLF